MVSIQALILEWNKKVGDEFAPGDIIVDIELEMCQADYEIDRKGFIAKILVDEGGWSPYNEPIAIFVDKKEDVKAFANYSLESAKEAAEAQPTPEAENTKKK